MILIGHKNILQYDFDRWCHSVTLSVIAEMTHDSKDSFSYNSPYVRLGVDQCDNLCQSVMDDDDHDDGNELHRPQ